NRIRQEIEHRIAGAIADGKRRLEVLGEPGQPLSGGIVEGAFHDLNGLALVFLGDGVQDSGEMLAVRALGIDEGERDHLALKLSQRDGRAVDALDGERRRGLSQFHSNRSQPQGRAQRSDEENSHTRHYITGGAAGSRRVGRPGSAGPMSAYIALPGYLERARLARF